MSDPHDDASHQMTTENTNDASTHNFSDQRRRMRNRELNDSALHIIRNNVATTQIPPLLVSACVKFIDFLTTIIVGEFIFYIYFSAFIDKYYNIAMFIVALFFIIFMHAFRAYSIPSFRNITKQLAKIVAAWSTAFVIVIIFTFISQLSLEYSRLWFGGWYIAGLITLFATHTITFILVRKWIVAGRLLRSAVIVGGGERGEALLQQLSKTQDHDVRIYGYFDDRIDGRIPTKLATYPNLGTIDDLVEFARHTDIDLIIVALPITAEKRVLQMLRKLWVLPVDIRLAAHTDRLRLHQRSYSYIGNVPLFDIFEKPIADWDIILKWLFDKIIGVIALITLFPIMILAALAIKMDSKGPIFFKQKRFGFNNELIEVYKFRSMYVDRCDTTANKLVTRDDPRVTLVGRFIRKTSLDELPQLINVVFRGNLSLVGPRPHALQAKAEEHLYQDVVDGYYARHKVKPGITGWAQVNGWRGETNTQEKIQRRVEHDLYYIENWSVVFDLYILLITPISLLSNTENAY